MTSGFSFPIQLLQCHQIFEEGKNTDGAPNIPELSQPQPKHNITQPQHSGLVGHENDFANPTHHTNSTAASVSLRTRFIDYN